jgi:hypothetical protein
METAPLKTFKSHVGGKNADVAIYPDRIEWSRAGRITATRVLTGAALVTGARKGGSSEMIPIRAISSVTTKKDGLMNHAVSLIAAGNTIDFRVSKPEAEEIKALVTRLMLG